MFVADVERGYRDIMVGAQERDRGMGAGVSQVQEVTRYLAKNDLYFMLTRVLGREDARQQWVLDRCRDYQAAPDGYLDLWFREAYKSSIITFAGIIQGLANDPERTYGIFSFSRPVAKSFLRQIKRELETNAAVQKLFPEVFWSNPGKQAPKWSEDEGLIVIRRGNQKESSVEAWGLIDGQPAGPHFSDLHYEDIVTKDAVRTPGMLTKVDDAFLESLNLGMRGGRRRAVGTRWHYADAYQTIIDKKIMKPRIWTATKNGEFDGEPWLFTREELKRKIEEYGPYIAGCQLFLNPVAESLQGFKEEWINYWKADRYKGLNLYILCDPASEKKLESDYTTMAVLGLGSDKNYYVINWIRDRLSLTQKANVLFKWHNMYKPIAVGYEQYGMQADIAHFRDRMDRTNYHFGITPLSGRLKKFDRIGRLVPVFSAGRFYLPESVMYTMYDGALVDLTRVFVNEEYKAHPFEQHDDMLDMLSRVLDDEFGATFPMGEEIDPLRFRNAPEKEYDPLRWGLEE